MGPKAVSVQKDGAEDGFVVHPGWWTEMSPEGGETRLVVSVPAEDLARVHAKLAEALSPPISFLYRQKVNRQEPGPPEAPPRDWVALNLPLDRVVAALAEAAPLVYHDARCEVWLRGHLNEQVVLDHDGVLYCYPDDPAFQDALREAGVPEGHVETVSDRDYVKHWFHAEADACETALVAALRLVEVRPQR